MALKVRDDLHIARRFYHFLGVAIIVYLFQIISRDLALKLTASFSVLTLIFEYLRFKYPPINRVLVKSFGLILRKQEIRNFSGMTYLILGVFLVVLIFPKSVATLALLFLAVGDPTASIIGILYGKDKIIGNKSFQGTLAAFIACSIVAFLYFSFFGIMVDRIILVSLLAGLIGAISEIFPIGRIDDNFSYPVIGASLLWLLFNLFGGYNV